MKYYIIIFTIILVACNTQNTEYIGSLPRTDTDGINKMGSGFYIDSSKSSGFYNTLENIDILNNIYVKEEFEKIETTQKIPSDIIITKWVRIRKYQGNYYLYDRCDGIEKMYFITNKAFIIKGVHEPELYPIIDINDKVKSELVIGTKLYYPDIVNQNIEFRIAKTKTEDVYLLQEIHESEIYQSLVAPIDKIRNFELIVNHCVEEKRIEFGEFDEVDFTAYQK